MSSFSSSIVADAGSTAKLAFGTIHELISETASSRPKKVAVDAHDGSMTYEQLESASNSLAARLRHNGVTRGAFVPLLFEKSKQMVVSILAVLKAGAAYVPLDASHPKARHVGVIERLGCSLVLGSANCLDVLQGLPVKLVIVDELSLGDRFLDQTLSTSGCKSQDTAYLIFTSGSTGQPKGVVISHGAITHAARSVGSFWDLDKTVDMRFLQWASHAFDASVLEMMFTLAHGGTLCIPSEDQRMNDLAGAMRDFQVTHAMLTPSIVMQILPEEVPSLQTLYLGGEKALESTAKAFSRNVTVWNAYGPTEGTILCCAVRISADWTPDIVGPPVGGYKCWIVDRDDYAKLSPSGKTGELLIEGPMLADGYFKEVEKSIAAFIVDPEWARGSGTEVRISRRFYRTGDLAYIDSAGLVHISGRMESGMRKLNGVRIDTNEIEHYLQLYLPSRWQAAVEICLVNQTQTLVAFLTPLPQNPYPPMLHDVNAVPFSLEASASSTTSLSSTTIDVQKELLASSESEGDALSISPPSSDDLNAIDPNVSFQDLTDEIQALLEKVLPTAMVPRMFHRLDMLPLTSSGKLDRRDLRNMNIGLVDLATNYDPQAREDESNEAIIHSVHEACAQALRILVADVEPEANLFRLGLNSILAIRLVSQLRKADIELTVADIFSNPSVIKLSQLVHRRTRPDPIPSFNAPTSMGFMHGEAISEVCSLCNVSATQVEQITRCTPFQGSVISASSGDDKDLYNMHMHFTLPDHVYASHFAAALRAVYESTPVLRARICSLASGELVQVVLTSEDPFHRQVTAGKAQPNPVQGLGHPLSCLEIHVGHKATVAVWTVSHAIIDGWTFSMALKKMESALAGLPVMQQAPFTDFVDKVTTLDHSHVLSYWKALLSDGTTEQFPRLPSGYAPITNAVFRHQIDVACSNTEYTRATMLTAAWTLALRQYTGSDVVGFTATSNGRMGLSTLASIENVEGPAIATMPVRHFFNSSDPVRKALEMCQKQMVEGLPFEQVGLQTIQQEVDGFHIKDWAQNTLVIQQDDAVHSLPSWIKDYNMVVSYPQALMMECILEPSAIMFRAYFDDNVTPALQMGRIVRHFAELYKQLATTNTATLSVGQLGSIITSDLQEITAWNTVTYDPVNCRIDELFRQAAQALPESQAVCAWDGDLSFRELDHLSDNLAARIQEAFGNSCEFVPVITEKSRWAVVAMLSILKANAACIPISKDATMDHVTSVLGELECSHVLVSHQAGKQLSLSSTQMLTFDEEMIRGLPDPMDGVQTSRSASDPCWVVFTSGTTGKPKGIVLQHSALSTGALYNGKILGLDKHSRVFNFAAFTFDVSFADIFYTLIHSGCVCLPSDEARLDDLAGAVNRLRATQMYLTSTVAASLTPADVPMIHTLAVGGEMVSPRVIRTWAEECKLVNIWGPAEATPWSCGSVVEHKTVDPRNIGSGLGANLWIADADDPQKLLAIGAVGEILIEGPLLARGYLNNKHKTSEAFISAPEWLKRIRGSATTARLYRTGDLAVYNPDGSIRFVGRREMASFVKVRGKRVDIAAVVETVRTLLPSDEIPLDVVQYGDTDSILAGFVTKKAARSLERLAGTDNPLAWFRKKLAHRLPMYMVPTRFILIEELPLSPNSKLNVQVLRRRAMTALAEDDNQAPNDLEMAPEPVQTPAERVVADAWKQVLPMSQVGRADSWMASGGDSLLAMRLALICRRSGLSIAVSDILIADTVQQIAERARFSAESDADQTPAPPATSTAYAPRHVLPPGALFPEVRKLAAQQCEVNETDIEEIMTSTSMQEAMMTSTVQDPKAYVGRQIWTLRPDLDIRRFKAAFETVVHRMPILRTRLIAWRSHLLQVVLKTNVTWETSSRLKSYIDLDRRRSYSLKSPLLRVGLISEEGTHTLVWTLHHALYDGFSMGIYLDALLDAYEGRQLHPTAPYALFVAATTTASKAADETAFWRSFLADAAAPTFPSSTPSGTSDGENGTVRQTIQIPQHYQFDSFLPACLQAAWGLVMARHADTDDIVLGVTLSGRSLPIDNIQSMAGPTLATLPMRIRIRPSQTIKALIAQVKDDVSSISARQTMGIPNIRALSESARDACNLRSLLIVQPPQDDVFANRFSSVFGHIEEDSVCKMDTLPLTAECTLSEDAVQVCLQYDKSILEEISVTRLSEHFAQVVGELMESRPDTLVSQLSMVTERDVAQISGWNSAPLSSYESCIHTFIGDNARETPNAAAVFAWDGAATYSRLWEDSATLSSVLCDAGVKPGVCVPIVFEKSIYAVVAVLATLRAGGTFVPLDPSQPLERLKGITQRIGAWITMCSQVHRGICHSLVDTVVEVDKVSLARMQSASRAVVPSTAPARGFISSETIAYIIHTSGTTGRPKAIPITHIQYCSGAYERRKGMFALASPRNLAFASHTFDTSIEDMLSSLMFGACVCIPSDHMRLHVPDLVTFINESRVNVADLTPSFVRLLKPDDVPMLKVLFLGGEPLTRELIEIWAPRVSLINAYGPSECSVTSVVNWDVTLKSDPKNIGVGTNTRTWIVEVDNVDRLVPIGTVGELLLEGPGVSNGYFDDPEKTAEGFITPPIWRAGISLPTARMYRTGDLCWYSSTGTVVYVGRADLQTKINSQRVQLEEVQGAIQALIPPTFSVIVDTVRVLCAFLAPADKVIEPGNPAPLSMEHSSTLARAAKVLDGIDVRLAETLPRYMIPTQFFCISALPMTASGKVDRKRIKAAVKDLLPVPVAGAGIHPDSKHKRMPETAVQRKMQRLWAHTLGIDVSSIGLDDVFMTQGGDSIAAMRLSANARTDGLALSVSDIFKYSTLVAMSEHTHETVNTSESTIIDTPVLSLALRALLAEVRKQLDDPTLSVEDCYPVTPFQRDMFGQSIAQPGAVTARFVYSLPTKDFDLGQFKDAWRDLCDANVLLRTRIVTVNGQFLQVVVKDEPQWVEAYEMDSFLARDAAYPMRLGGRLNRTAIVSTKARTHQYFVWTANHAVYDGWSLERLMIEVCQRYLGRTIPLRPAFANFVRYAMDLDRGSIRSFWTTELANLRSKPFAKATARRPSATHTICREIGIRPERDCLFTTATIIQLACIATFAQATGSNDVLLAMTLTGRASAVAHADSMAGPLAAEVPFRWVLHRSSTLHDSLGGVQRKTQSLAPYEQVGWGTFGQSDPALARQLDETAVPLIIHPRAAKSRYEENGLTLELCRSSSMRPPPVPFQLDCSLLEDGVEVAADYDPQILAEEDVEGLLKAMEAKISLICRWWRQGTVESLFE